MLSTTMKTLRHLLYKNDYRPEYTDSCSTSHNLNPQDVQYFIHSYKQKITLLENEID